MISIKFWISTECFTVSGQSETPIFSDICGRIRLLFYGLIKHSGGFDFLNILMFGPRCVVILVSITAKFSVGYPTFQPVHHFTSQTRPKNAYSNAMTFAILLYYFINWIISFETWTLTVLRSPSVYQGMPISWRNSTVWNTFLQVGRRANVPALG